MINKSKETFNILRNSYILRHFCPFDEGTVKTQFSNYKIYIITKVYATRSILYTSCLKFVYINSLYSFCAI